MQRITKVRLCVPSRCTASQLGREALSSSVLLKEETVLYQASSTTLLLYPHMILSYSVAGIDHVITIAQTRSIHLNAGSSPNAPCRCLPLAVWPEVFYVLPQSRMRSNSTQNILSFKFPQISRIGYQSSAVPKRYCASHCIAYTTPIQKKKKTPINLTLARVIQEKEN